MINTLCFAATVVAHYGGHAGAHHRRRLENAGAEHVQGVREEDRPDQRGLLQVLQGYHTCGLRARGQDTELAFPGPDQGPAHTGPEAGPDHVHTQTAGGT